MSRVKRKRWPDCRAGKVVPRHSDYEPIPPLELRCTKPALHLGKHLDAWAQFSWRSETSWERLA